MVGERKTFTKNVYVRYLLYSIVHVNIYKLKKKLSKNQINQKSKTKYFKILTFTVELLF